MPSVLVTGASRGIGKAIATHLAERGWDVFAGVRSDADAERLRAEGASITPVTLDVTDQSHLAALDKSLPQSLDAVVNNAGVVVAGPMEFLAPADLHHQLDINVVGQIAVTQAVLPRLRRSRGRIVFISSLNGRFAMPLTGAYCASKFALEAAADAMRMELKPWDIAVVVVEPAQTNTDIWRTADTMAEEAAAGLTDDGRRLYDKHIAGFKKSIPTSQRMAGPVERVASVVEEALTARRPRARYVVGMVPKVQAALLSRLPIALRDRVLRGMLKQPG